MKVKALKSFVGKVSMSVGDVLDIADEEIAKDLIKAKYVINVAKDEVVNEVKKVETEVKKAEPKKKANK